jgi:hypothetical protein
MFLAKCKTFFGKILTYRLDREMGVNSVSGGVVGVFFWGGGWDAEIGHNLLKKRQITGHVPNRTITRI